MIISNKGDVLSVETFVMGILGVFGTFIVQGIKKYAGTTTIEGTKALNLTVVVSAVLAVIGAFATDAFLDVNGSVTIGSVVNGAFIVFGVGTLIYKYLISRDTAPVTPPDTPLT
jgi:hypothetical protein